MRTNVAKNDNKQTLLNIGVDIGGTDEHTSLIKFFGFLGMKASFLDEYQGNGYTLRKLKYGIQHGSFKTGMLRDVRQFVEDHKGEVEEFLNNEQDNSNETKTP